MTLWSKHTEKTNEERGDDAPFRLKNYTGYTLHVWPESRDLSKKPIGMKSLQDGQEFPWRFENAARAREVSHFASRRSHGLTAVECVCLATQLVRYTDSGWKPEL